MKSILLTLALGTGFAVAGSLPPPAAPPSSVPPPPIADSLSSGFNYNFLQLGWNHADLDGAGTGDGYYAGLSLSPVEHLILFANWSQVWADKADLRSFNVGAGGYVPVCNKVDFVGTAAFGWADADILETLTLDQNTFRASAGFRIAFTDWLEFNPAYVFTVGDGDVQSSAVGQLLFDIGTDVQLVVHAIYDDTQSAYGAGIRYNF